MKIKTLDYIQKALSPFLSVVDEVAQVFHFVKLYGPYEDYASQVCTHGRLELVCTLLHSI